MKLINMITPIQILTPEIKGYEITVKDVTVKLSIEDKIARVQCDNEIVGQKVVDLLTTLNEKNQFYVSKTTAIGIEKILKFILGEWIWNAWFVTVDLNRPEKVMFKNVAQKNVE